MVSNFRGPARGFSAWIHPQSWINGQTKYIHNPQLNEYSFWHFGANYGPQEEVVTTTTDNFDLNLFRIWPNCVVLLSLLDIAMSVLEVFHFPKTIRRALYTWPGLILISSAFPLMELFFSYDDLKAIHPSNSFTEQWHWLWVLTSIEQLATNPSFLSRDEGRFRSMAE